MAQVVKAVKGSFFGTNYWSGKMKLGAASSSIRKPSDPFWDDIFLETSKAQRELNVRRVLDQMVPYLEKNGPFFSALTVILVPSSGDKLEEGVHYTWDASSDPDIGKLTIEDEVLMFPADGQHRREALAQALQKNKSLISNEVPIIFLPFESVERVRQLFADLNLYAKTPNKTIGLDFDSRDPVVLVTKRMIQEVPLFEDGARVNVKTNSLAAKSPAVISLNTLVEMNKTILAALLDTTVKGLPVSDEIKAIEGKELEDPNLVHLAEKVAQIFQVVIDALPAWQDLETGTRSAGQMRDGVKNGAGELQDEGYVFAFGIGWQALALVAAAVIRIEGEEWSESLQRAIESVDWHKGPQWHGVAMVGTRVNNTGPGIRATAGMVLNAAGYDKAEDDDVQSLIKAYKASLEAAEPYETVAG